MNFQTELSGPRTGQEQALSLFSIKLSVLHTLSAPAMPEHIRFSTPSPPPAPQYSRLLGLPAETRLRVYHFVTPIERMVVNYPTWHRSRCPSSRTHSLLATCSILRQEFLPYLLAHTHIRLADGARPRKRSHENNSPIPRWHICHIRHVLISNSIDKKMQFELFPELEVLTLQWPKILTVTISSEFMLSHTTYLYTEECIASIVSTVYGAARATPEAWIQRLLGRKRKRFSLRVLATIGCKDNAGVQGNKLIVRPSFLSS